MLYIEAAPASWKGTNEVYCGLGGYPAYKTIEQAGYAYQALVRRRMGIEEVVVKAKVVEAPKVNEEDDKYHPKNHKRTIETANDDPYVIMGLDHLRWKATEDDVKIAYRKLVLYYHPDKMQLEDKTEEADALFKKISKANDTLTDVKKRMKCDSNDAFDDTIPSGKEKGDFYKVYNEYFYKFSRWSTAQPVPVLGDDSTALDKVKKFYDFWYSFKSWRDYSFEDEHDLSKAESRDEKRWMERENDKERRKHKKEESSRIFKMTETIEKLDPRLRRQKDEILNAKQKIKDDKAAERKKKQDEIDAKIKAEADAKAAEESKKVEESKDNKVAQNARKKQMRALRTKLRGFFTDETKPMEFKPSEEDIETVCERLKIEKMTELVALFEAGDEKAPEMFKKEVEVLHNTHFDIPIVKTPSPSPKPANKSNSNNSNSKDNSNKPWSEDELSLLAKAMSKYPGGVNQRWELISQFVGTRSVKEIIAKSKDSKAGEKR